MNDSAIDGNENVIDVFVLSNNEAGAPVRPEHLEQKGYRVTLFSGSSQLLETLRYGKPNLLVCDSLSLGEEAYEVCRQIKTDNDLWMIPVLIVTRASNLSDLLHVLDCNADNFIAYPFDAPYLVSLIEGMLVTPVERQTPDQVKTQFKIQHEDHLFVVMADRRKLLEFLLSSFEIAVNKSDELARALSHGTSLTESLKNAEDTLAERGRVMVNLGSTLEQREQAITLLNDELAEKARKIEELSREKDFLLQEREENKSRIAGAEEENRRLIQEHEESVKVSSAEAGELRNRIAYLSDELTTANADLAATRKALEDETTRCDSAEATLKDLVPEKDVLEKNYRVLTLEAEQLKVACTAEKNRASAAEQEVKSLLLAKAQSEQDLTRIIDELKETAKQQAGEVSRLRDERTADRDQIATLETRVAEVTRDKETTECNLKNTAENLMRDLSAQKDRSSETAQALAEKERQYAALDEKRREKESLCQQLQAELTSTRSILDETKSALTREQAQHTGAVEALQAAVRERDAALSSLQGAHAEVKTDLDSHRDELVAARQDLTRLEDERNALLAKLEEKTTLVRDLEMKLHSASGDRAELDKHIRSLSDEFEQLKASLESERRQRRISEDNLKASLAEGERSAELARKVSEEREQLAATLTSERESARVEREELNARIAATLESARAEQEGLAATLAQERESAHVEREELNARMAVTLESAKQQQEGLAATLAQERESARVEREELNARMTATLESARAEQERLAALLASEREELQVLGERGREAGEVCETRVRELTRELAGTMDTVRGLEEQVESLKRERDTAIRQAANFESELDQARVALADEWGDHMTDNERLAAAVEEKRELERSIGRVASVSTSSPVIVQSSNQPELAEGEAPVVATSPEADIGRHTPDPVTGVEDLFEDTGDRAADEPSVVIIRDTDPEVTIDRIGEETVGGISADESVGRDTRDMVAASADTSDEDLQEEYGGEESDSIAGATMPYSPVAGPAQVYSFDRTQWFDLLKWAHHSGALSQEQRLQIVRMGRLVQKGRRLTHKQDEQVREILGLVQSLGYRFS